MARSRHGTMSDLIPLCAPNPTSISRDPKTPADQARVMMTKNLEQAHEAIANYFQLVEKTISASPLGATDQTKTFRNYVERSVAASFRLSDKLLRAKDFQDVVRIQTEFFQTQLKALTENSKEFSGTTTNAASDVTRVQIK
jgi:hypothetical protein